MTNKTTFTPLYDWIAQRKDLSLLEKMVICRVLRYGESGCFESYSNIAKAFHVDRSNLIRTIKSLVQRQWLAPLYEAKRRRVLFVDQVHFSDDCPLFDLPAVRKAKGSGASPPGSDLDGGGLAPPSGGFAPRGGGAIPPGVVAPDHPMKDGYSKHNSTHLENESLFEHLPEKIGIDDFWNEYPRKETKQRVVAWFQKNKPSRGDIERMIYTIRQQSSKGGRLYWGVKKYWQYVPLPTTWLNDGDWQEAPTLEELEKRKAEHERKKKREEDDRKARIRQEHKQFFREKTTEQLGVMLTQRTYMSLHWLIQEIMQEKGETVDTAFAGR